MPNKVKVWLRCYCCMHTFWTWRFYASRYFSCNRCYSRDIEVITEWWTSGMLNGNMIDYAHIKPVYPIAKGQVYYAWYMFVSIYDYYVCVLARVL